jgi:DNA-binding NtrC family response regulator
MSRATGQREPTPAASTAAGIDRDKLADLVADAIRNDPAFGDHLRAQLDRLAAPPAQGAAAASAPSGDPAAEQMPATPSSASAADNDFFMVGSSAPMLAVFEQIRRCATSDAPVLISGESGTGKELAARAIHERSARERGPFVIINCAALPATLIASELFGYEKGAFTGATARKIGRLEAANHGTVFLDEIGDLPLDLQGHLLRFLQEKVIERVGGNKPIALDVRVVAATHVSLLEAVRRGAFRDDLFYRLHVLTLEMPPLRARGDDLMLLAMYTLRQVEKDAQGPARSFARSAISAIMAHDWPGNVRELIACIRRATVFASGPTIEAEDLGIVPTSLHRPIEVAAAAIPAGPTPVLGDTRPDVDRVREVLLRHGYNIRRAARDYGVSRVTMYRLIQRFGIEVERRRVPRSDGASPPGDISPNDDT